MISEPTAEPEIELRLPIQVHVHHFTVLLLLTLLRYSWLKLITDTCVRAGYVQRPGCRSSCPDGYTLPCYVPRALDEPVTVVTVVRGGDPFLNRAGQDYKLFLLSFIVTATHPTAPVPFSLDAQTTKPWSSALWMAYAQTFPVSLHPYQS